MKRIYALAAVALAAGVARGQVFVESFDSGTNAAGWSFGAPTESIQPTGGNPGGYLHGSGLDTTIPFVRTGVGVASPFVGDYRQALVNGAGVDVIVHATDFPIGSFPLALILVSDNGTPGNSADDWGAYTLHAQGIPLPGQGWRRFLFQIDTQSASLPAGWQFIQFGPGNTPDWNALVTNVSRMEYSFGDPSGFYIFQMWDVGADNPQIAYVDLCYPNCDGSTQWPFLNVNDFLCFLNKYSRGDTYANCDGSSIPPILNINDFVCFQTKFAQGCQ